MPGADPLKGPVSFWVFDAQIYILPLLETFSLIFDIYFNTKADKIEH